MEVLQAGLARLRLHVHSHTRRAHPSLTCLDNRVLSLWQQFLCYENMLLFFSFYCPFLLLISLSFFLPPSLSLSLSLPPCSLCRLECFAPYWCCLCCTPILRSCLWALWFWVCSSAVSTPTCWPTPKTYWTTEVLLHFRNNHCGCKSTVRNGSWICTHVGASSGMFT